MVKIKMETERDFILAMQKMMPTIAQRINKELNLHYPVEWGKMTFTQATLAGGHLYDIQALYFRTGPDAWWLARVFGSNKGKQLLLEYNQYWKTVTLHSNNTEIRRIVQEEIEKTEKELGYEVTLEIKDEEQN